MCNKPPPTYICCAREYCNEKQNLHDDDNSNNDVRQSTIVIDRFDDSSWSSNLMDLINLLLISGILQIAKLFDTKHTIVMQPFSNLVGVANFFIRQTDKLSSYQHCYKNVMYLRPWLYTIK